MISDENWGIIGHEWAVGLLRHGVSTETLSHAYLLTGSQGIGKTTLARSLAAALLCTSTPDQRPCGHCRSCQLVLRDAHPDVHLVESASVGESLKIDQVRDLQRRMALTPAEGRWRVAILRRFQEATPSAANALLKTLEEPPSYGLLLVLARSVDQLLPTIISRCQHLSLRPLPVFQIEQALVQRWEADPEHAKLLAHLSAGRLGWAVRALRSEAALEHREERIQQLDQLLGSTLRERFRVAEKLASDAKATQETLDLWTSWWRDVALVASGASVSLIHIDQRQTLSAHARRFGLRRSVDVVDAVLDTRDRLQRNANPRLALEVLMLDLPHR